MDPRGDAVVFQKEVEAQMKMKDAQKRRESYGARLNFRGYERWGFAASANRLPSLAVTGRSLDRQVAEHFISILCNEAELSNPVG